MDIITRKQALAVSTLITLFLGVYHTMIIIQFMPSQHVWLGMIDSHESLLRHESFSITLLVVLLVTLLLEYLQLARKTTRIIFYVFIVIFVLNTIANLFAPTPLEQIGFSFLTSVMALMMYQLTIRREHLNEASYEPYELN